MSFTLSSQGPWKGETSASKTTCSGMTTGHALPTFSSGALSPSAGRSTACSDPFWGTVTGEPQRSSGRPMETARLLRQSCLGVRVLLGLTLHAPPPACLSLSHMSTPQSPGQARRFLPPHPPGRSALTFPIHKQFIEESQIFDFPETKNMPLP